MKIKHLFVLFVVVLHAIFLVLSLHLLQQSPWLFLAAEAVIIGSIVLSAVIYRQFVRPLDLITSGIESIRDKDFGMKFVPVGQSELDSLIDVYNRMIDQLRLERINQQEQHFFLQKLIQSSPSGLITLQLDGTVHSVNPAAQRMIGRSEEQCLGRQLHELEGLAAQHLAKMPLNAPQIVHLQQRALYRIHKAAFIDRGFERFFIQIEELTREILQTERAAYERVIRMISHEMNNSIGAVNSILQSSISSNTGRNNAKVLEIALRRNQHLISFMANFAKVYRLPVPIKSPVEINQLLTALQPLMAGNSTKSINWVWHLSAEPLTVHLDENQFEQVALNVLKNSMEAVPEDGTITISTQLRPVRRLQIHNDGPAILPAVEAKLFSPFFTTKETGQGIGLTLIQEILRNHDFSFGLENEPRGGVVFWVEFE